VLRFIVPSMPQSKRGAKRGTKCGVLLRLVIVCAAAIMAGPHVAQAADAQGFTLKYRGENRWVHQDDKAQLNALSNYANAHQVHTFEVIMPEQASEPVYIERLLILSKILKQRLHQPVVVFRQSSSGETPPNTIRIMPVN